MLLAGIKTGKKKKTATPVAAADNASVADQLRASLQKQAAGGGRGGIAPHSPAASSTVSETQHNGNTSSKNNNNNNNAIVLMDRASHYHVVDNNNNNNNGKEEADLTVQELVVREKRMASGEIDRQEERNVMRRGQRKRHYKEAVDSDEEEERQMASAGLTHQSQKTKRLPDHHQQQQQQQRERARQIAHHDRQDQITAHCHWWMESSRFDRTRLLALGDCVSLVLAPRHQSVGQHHHCYLVPIPHAPSWTCCDVDAWNELRRFQTSLRRMARAKGMAVLFYETVLPNTTSSSSTSFWQTRMEAVVVPPNVVADAPLYFKTALVEQAEEWGTHQKLMPTGGTTHKELRATVPPNFAYFYVEYGDQGEGYVQLIESRSFPKDFGADTVLGMMRMDPLRFRSRRNNNNNNIDDKQKKPPPEDERQRVRQFLEDWKPFDWTTELDA